MKVLFRAKSLYGDKEYIISQSIKFEYGNMFLYSIPFKQWVECDEATRSINFEDMLDSEGTKIFASLSQSGRGGDEYTDCLGNKNIFIFNSSGTIDHFVTWGDFKVTGIQND